MVQAVASEAYHDWSGEAADAQLRVNFTLKFVGSISWLVRRGHGRATTCELYAKIHCWVRTSATGP